MAYTTINKQTDNFNTKLYTGTGSNQTISNTFQSDMIWVKGRNYAYNHSIQDAVRGFSANKVIYPNLTNVEGHYSDTGYIQSVASNNFVVGTGTHSDDANYNDNGSTYVAWNWKANGSGSANTDGSINSTVSVNQTAGFSIVKYTGTGSNASVGHGLSSAPKMIIEKQIDSGSNDWGVYHASKGAGHYTKFNTNEAFSSHTGVWQGVEPTNSVFYLGNSSLANASGGTHIAYCFTDVVGFSKFNYYSGNFANDGTFIYTGFAPQLVIVKKRDATGNFRMFDNVRDPANPAEKWFNADSNAVEGTDIQADLLSNGFKLRDAANAFNTSGSIYIYMAWGQSLVGSNNVPCTAR